MIREALPRAHARARELGHLIELTVEGLCWRDASERSGISWAEVNAYKRHYPEFAKLWAFARDGGQEYRRMIREEEDYRRAMSGWLEPVFDDKCRKVGEIRKFSTRRMIRSLRAGDPEHHGASS